VDSLFDAPDPAEPETRASPQAMGSTPLADRVRPVSFGEVAGQPALTEPGSPLRAALAAGQAHSLILWGPPGSGKTTIAHAIAANSPAAFEQLNAVTDGIRELRAVTERAGIRAASGRQTLLFIDEIARWNKAQQDALLPFVESGAVVLIGATTEHPGREINPALMSRLKLYRVEPLDDRALEQILERGLASALAPSGDSAAPPALELDSDAREHLFLHAGGDARVLLNAVEAAAALLPGGGLITLDIAQRASGSRRLSHDKAGEQHYNLISALIKSIRGSDPDAALYWLARLEAGGEDPAFVARRLVISASEEIGVAAPHALGVAMATLDAVKAIGPPECWINLAATTCFLAECPKSWASYEGWRSAQQVVEHEPAHAVPLHLRNATTAIDRTHGVGEGYVHASQRGAAAMRFLPEALEGRRFYGDRAP